MKRSFSLVFILLTCVLLANGMIYATARSYEKVKAQVLEERVNQEDIITQTVKVRILEGELMGKVLQFEHQPIRDSKYDILLQKNMKIFIQLTIENNRPVQVYFEDVVRETNLGILFGLFFILLLIFGGFKGFRAFISLIVTGLCIFKIFLPMILSGHSFLYTTVIVCCVIIFTSFILISGFTRKSLSAILGTIGGTLFSGLLALYFGNKIYLMGISDETIQMLATQSNQMIDYRGLLYSGITIGVLGAVMDVSMTITSVIYEIKRNSNGVRISSLIISGFSVGKDIMATMTNTLILAYAGTSLPLLFVLALSDMTMAEVVNSQYIASEIVRALSGSVGLILTIPITSIFAAINS